MKVLHAYRDFLEEGGVPYEARSLARAQAQLGHEVMAVSLKKSTGSRVSPGDFPLPVVEVENGARGLAMFRDVLRTFKPDVVHFYSLWVPVHNLWAREVLRVDVPYVVAPHGALNPYMLARRFGEKRSTFVHHSVKWAYRRFMDIPFLRRAVAVHALSDYEASLALEVGAKRVFIAPNGVDQAWLRPFVRRELHRPVTFLYLGRLDIYQKGLDLILDAFGGLVKDGLGSTFRLVFAGPSVGDSMGFLKKRARELGVDVEFTGAVWGDEKERVWREANFFLHASRFEGMARAVREAVAHGVPVVASRESNYGDWIERMGSKFRIGRVFSIGERKALERILRDLLQIGTETYTALAENALSWANRYTWTRVAACVLRGYEGGSSVTC